MTKVKKSFLIDMDGVLVNGSTPIPGAKNFIQALLEEERKFLVVTNNALYTTRDLAHLLQVAGLDIPEENIYTSAVATAEFLEDQLPKGKAFVIGEVGLTEAIHRIGYVQTPVNPDYVVLGETTSYSFDQITVAIRLINNGARFIATNPDLTGPSEQGIIPSTGAMAALIEAATGKAPLYIGKPNPLMMRSALNHLGVHSEDSFMIGDNMRTDILAGISAGMDTVLVLTGVMKASDIPDFPYRPAYVYDSIGDIKMKDLD
ncbi:MAG TPA: HAD-IIA family hydrolase [Anaerolineaceae bacterium]|jgi:NagD protein|nr:HAD-IIA family hydrolase [Anaerolineaceae bacterium]